MPEPPDPPAGGLTYDPELGPGYFVQTRADFLRSPAFTPLAKLLYQVLLTYCGAGDQAWPGLVRLATDCTVGETALRQAMKDLQAAGLVTVTRRGLNYTNLYHVHKLPLVLSATREARNPRIKTVESAGSKPARSTAKVHSVESQSEETGIDPALIAAIRTWAYQHKARVTESDVAALARAAGTLARWQAVSAGAGTLAAVQARLEEG